MGGYALTARAFLYAQLYWCEEGIVPVAYLIAQGVVAWPQGKCATRIGQSVFGPALARLAVDVAEVKP